MEVMEAVGGAALPRLACRSPQCQAWRLLPSSSVPPQLPPHPPSSAEREGGREGRRKALPGWAASPSLCPVPLEVDSRKEAGLAGALSCSGDQQGTNTKKAEEVPWRLLLLPPSSLAVKMQHEQMANINATMEG